MLNSAEDAHRKSMSTFETDEHLQVLMFVRPLSEEVDCLAMGRSGQAAATTRGHDADAKR